MRRRPASIDLRILHRGRDLDELGSEVGQASAPAECISDSLPKPSESLLQRCRSVREWPAKDGLSEERTELRPPLTTENVEGEQRVRSTPEV